MKSEYLLRIKAIQDYLRANKPKAFLVMTPANRYYLSGFAGTEGSILITSRSANLFVDGRYTLRAKRESALPVRDIDSLGTVLARYRAHMVAIESEIRLKDLRKLRSRYEGLRWKETSNVVEDMRHQKNRAELRLIRKGAAYIDDAFYYVCKLVAQNKVITEIELALEIERYGRENGAHAAAFEPIVAWGRNAALPHHANSSQKIGNNNFLLLDFGFTIEGYQSDFTRTLFIGNPSSRQRELYESVLTAQQRAIEAVRIGRKASDIDEAARSYLVRSGYGDYFTHNTGHGVGIEIHELPTLSPQSKERMLVNSVVTIEPGVYLPNKFGVRIEDMVLVGKQPRVFSHVPKNWEAMVIEKK